MTPQHDDAWHSLLLEQYRRVRQLGAEEAFRLCTTEAEMQALEQIIGDLMLRGRD